MNALSSIVVALVLCVLSGGLVAWHIRTWKRLQQAEIEPREREFRRRQYRRRMQTSAMLGVLGMAILIGQLLMIWITSWLLLAIYWSGLLLLVLWVVLLAVADMTASVFFYSREKNSCLAEQAKLQGELRQAQDEEAPARNGKPRRA